MPCPNITEIPITYELNSAALLFRNVKDSNRTLEGVHNLPDLLTAHIARTAYGVYGFVFITAHYYDTCILDAAVHQGIDLLPKSSGRNSTRDGSGIIRQKADTQMSGIVFSYELTCLADVTSDSSMRIKCCISNILL